MKIETTMPAWASCEYAMSAFLDCLAAGKGEQAANQLHPTPHDMTGTAGWVKVGTAHITIELLDAKEIQNEQLAMLQAQLQKERADSQVRQNAILDQISKLQALEWEGVQA